MDAGHAWNRPARSPAAITQASSSAPGGSNSCGTWAARRKERKRVEKRVEQKHFLEKRIEKEKRARRDKGSYPAALKYLKNNEEHKHVSQDPFLDASVITESSLSHH